MESLLELKEQIFRLTFLPVALAIILVVAAGSGLWKTRRMGAVLVVSLVLLAAALTVGIGRHEWGEVLFNGQIL